MPSYRVYEVLMIMEEYEDHLNGNIRLKVKYTIIAESVNLEAVKNRISLMERCLKGLVKPDER